MMSYFRNMAVIQLLLLLTCIALSSGAASDAKTDAELSAKAEAESVTDIEHAMAELQSVLTNSHEPFAHRLELAQEHLAPVLAALEAHKDRVLLVSRDHIEQLAPALRERLEAVRALLGQTQKKVVEGVAERGGAALTEAASAVAHAREELASLWPTSGDASSTGDARTADTAHTDH